MVVIRLTRGGANKRPFYPIVVTDKRNRRDGKFIERVGFYNPVARGKEVELKIDIPRVDHWISKGAQPSEKVASLIKKAQKIQKTTPDAKESIKPKSAAKTATTSTEAVTEKVKNKASSATKKKTTAEKSAKATAKEAAPATEKPATKVKAKTETVPTEPTTSSDGK